MDTNSLTSMIRRAVVTVAVLVATSLPGVGWAQQAGNSQAAGETSIHGGWLVIVSYIVLWVGLLGYVGWLAWRQHQLDEELERLEGRLDEEFEHLAERRE